MSIIICALKVSVECKTIFASHAKCMRLWNPANAEKEVMEYCLVEQVREHLGSTHFHPGSLTLQRQKGI